MLDDILGVGGVVWEEGGEREETWVSTRQDSRKDGLISSFNDLPFAISLTIYSSSFDDHRTPVDQAR